jgi:small membrane protein
MLGDYLVLQILVSIFVIFAVSRSFLSFRARNSTLFEFTAWILVWGTVLVVVWVPSITGIPARLLGIGRGIDFIVYVSIVLLLYSVYRIYSKIEKIEQDITTLTRDIAIGKKKK